MPAQPTTSSDAASHAAPALDAAALVALARDARLIWPPAAAVAALGAGICLFALPGINWGLWTLAAALGLVYVNRRSRRPLPRSAAGTLVGAVLLAFTASVTGDEGFQVIALLGTASLAAVATLFATGIPAECAGVVFLVTAPFRCAARVVAEACTRVVELTTLVRPGRNSGMVRGVLLALPIIAVLALLLSAADPVLARLREDVFSLVNDSGAIARVNAHLVFFIGLGMVTLGAYGLVVRPDPAAATRVKSMDIGRIVLSDIERWIILGSVAGLFAVFVALQVSYLFGNAPAIAGSGLTYAEYAHRGFGELTVAASLSAVLVLRLDAHAQRGAREGRIRLTGLALLFLVQLVLDSAFRRIVLYEAAYGYTEARLYAKIYMIIVSLALIALGIEIWGRVDARRLARRVAVAGVAALIGLGYWNHQAWIAQRNLDRVAATGTLDAKYLVFGLSANAIPTVVRALPTLPPKQAAATREALTKWRASRANRAHWYEWNLRDREARAALASIGIR